MTESKLPIAVPVCFHLALNKKIIHGSAKARLKKSSHGRQHLQQRRGGSPVHHVLPACPARVAKQSTIGSRSGPPCLPGIMISISPGIMISNPSLWLLLRLILLLLLLRGRHWSSIMLLFLRLGLKIPFYKSRNPGRSRKFLLLMMATGTFFPSTLIPRLILSTGPCLIPTTPSCRIFLLSRIPRVRA